MKKMPLTLVALFASATTAFAAEYEIGTLEELREFMEAVHVEDFAGDTITLTADIDCERGRFNTGDPEYPSTFRGTFDGGGHVISNFVHAATGSTQEGYGVAMFDFAETGAAILNLTLEGTLPGTASGAYAAPFVLAVESPLGLFMDNCHFRGSVTNYYHAAGLVGFASSGTGAEAVPSVVLTNCSVRGEIVSTWVYTAGGLVAKGTGVQAFDCSVEGELHGGRTGGLVGEAYGGSFEGCSFGGTMRPDREIVGNCIQGGLAAETSNAVFRACSATVEASNLPGDQNTLTLAGFAASVGSGALISNCHVKVDWQGVHPDSYVGSDMESCQYYGLAHTVSGACIRIVGCTVEGRLAGGTRACGFVGSATLDGGEIARCAVFADVSTLANSTDGMAAGFAGSLSLSGGAVVRECFSAGVVDAAADAAGFACEISMRDDQSQVRDCYSTAEVLSGENQNPAGFACRISDNNDEGGVLPVANCWFGGTVRVRGTSSGYYQPYGFAYMLEGDASLENCAWVAVDGVKEAGTPGATAISQAASRKAASWPGYDFAVTWSLSEDETTPYFAWSLAEGTDFRLFAVQEEGKPVSIGESAAPGAEAAVSAVAEDSDLVFCGWTGGASYTNASAPESALLADNHRTARCVWGKAVATRADLVAIADDPSGTYGLAADIDLGGEPWTPLCLDEYEPFTGTLYGNGHTISNMTVETETARAGLFGGLGSGATIADLNLANPVVRGANCVGSLAGFVDGATISGCTVSGADVTASGERAGCFVGQLEGGSSISRCSATGSIAGSDRYVGGFVGSAAGSTVLEKCFALAEVSGAGEGTGGFVGYAEGSPSFSECFACGSVDSTGTSAGGFAGYLSGSPAVSDCYALETVKGGSYVGGFAGHFYYCDGAFERCYAAGAVESAGRYAGGLVGYVGNGTSILGCSAAGSVKATGNYAYAGGFVGGSDGGTFEIRDCVSSAEVTATAAYVGGFVGYVTGSGASVISGCRADGYAGGHGSVGGFVGYVNSPMTISNCVARGDVRSTGSYYGGFVGYFYNNAATIEDCWCSGAVWGAGGTIGSFVGYLRGNGTIEDCSIYAFGAGPRPFCGSDGTFEGGSLTASQIDVLSADWPKVKLHVEDATPISTAEELFAVTNNLSGVYVLKNDIDLEGATISPIGNDSTAFSGEFYGKNHKIKNFVVNSTARYTGLFGQISGGRVNGVRAEGTVTGAYASSGSSTGTGGFAGLVGSQSLVDGCSFEGAVTNTTTYNAGGFVGRTEGAPVLLRSYFVGTVVHQANDKSNAGGFAGDHGGGYVMDCYAIADVEAGNSRYAAGFAGNAGGRIATSWCAGAVEGTGNNRGAFAGYAQTGYITDSYYDSGKTDLNAVGNATSYDGISALATEDMLHEASFEGFDFVATWRIDEGATTPYLLTFTVQKTGYEQWLEDNGLPDDTAPEAVEDGVPYLIRYVFDRPTGAFSPFTGISFNDDGDVVVSMLPIANADAVTVKVLASTSLTDWSHAEETEITVQSDGTIVFPRTTDPSRFFRLKVEE